MKYGEEKWYGEERERTGIWHSCMLNLSPQTSTISYPKTLTNTLNAKMKYGQ